jgi:hypothetical protein
LELFSLEEKAAQLPGGLFVFRCKMCARDFCQIRQPSLRELRLEFCVFSVATLTDLRSTEVNQRQEDVMFCDGCGAAVEPGQLFCSKCGKQIIGSIAQPAFPGRVQRHLHLLAILWLGFSAFNTLGGLVLLLLGNVLFPHLHEMPNVPPDVPAGFLTALFSTLGIIVLAKAAFGFFAGWGLLQRENWARTMTLILAFIALFLNIPIGTAMGVYTMWVLLPAQSQQEYEALVAARKT